MRNGRRGLVFGAAIGVVAIACKKEPPPEKAPIVATPAPSANRAVTAKERPFSLLATSGNLHLVSVGKDEALLAGGPLPYRLAATGKLEQDPLLLKGLRGPQNRRVGYFGAWPDAFASAEDPSADPTAPSPAKLFRYGKDAWSSVAVADPPARRIDGVVDWKEGRKLAIVEDNVNDVPGWSFRLVAGKFPVVLPTPGAPTMSVDQGGPRCWTRMIPASGVGFETGEIFVIGAACDAPGATFDQLERWEPTKTTSVAEPLDGKPGNLTLIAGTVKQVWAVRALPTAAAFHYDGYSFKSVPLPEKTDTHVAIGFDGDATYLGLGTHLYRQKDTGEWEVIPIALPVPQGTKKPTIWEIAALGGELFLTVFDVQADAKMLFGTKAPPGAEVAVLPSESDEKKAALGPDARAAFDAASAACTSIVVPLQANVTAAPTFPKISAALADVSLDGVTFVLDDWGGGTMLEARVPTIAVGQKLVDRLKEKAAPTIAKVVCHVPKITGTVTP